jgi:hypothetical protein
LEERLSYLLNKLFLFHPTLGFLSVGLACRIFQELLFMETEAAQMVDLPMGWVSSRPETKLTSDWPMGTMLDIQERSKDQCRIAEDGVYCHVGLSPVVYEKDYTSLPTIVGYIQMLSKSIIKLPNSQESGS